LTILKTNHIITALPTLYYIYIRNVNHNLQNSALWRPQHMYVYCDIFYCWMF